MRKRYPPGPAYQYACRKQRIALREAEPFGMHQFIEAGLGHGECYPLVERASKLSQTKESCSRTRPQTLANVLLNQEQACGVSFQVGADLSHEAGLDSRSYRAKYVPRDRAQASTRRHCDPLLEIERRARNLDDSQATQLCGPGVLPGDDEPRPHASRQRPNTPNGLRHRCAKFVDPIDHQENRLVGAGYGAIQTPGKSSTSRPTSRRRLSAHEPVKFLAARKNTGSPLRSQFAD